MKRVLIIILIFSINILFSPLKSMPFVGYEKKISIVKFQEDTTIKKKKNFNSKGSVIKYQEKQKLSLILASRDLNQLIEPWKVDYNYWNNNKKYIK